MKRLLVESALLTVVTLLLTLVIGKLSETRVFRFIFPETIALEGFDLTDIAFKERIKPGVNEQIVIVNVGAQSRRQIARQIEIISKYKPRVIGVDLLFDCNTGFRDTINCPQLTDREGNLMLSNALKSAGNVILVSRLLQRDTTLEKGSYDSLRRSDQMFLNHAVNDGYSNLDTEAAFQDNVTTCRTFRPNTVVKENVFYPFSVSIAMLYDSVKTQKFIRRGNANEAINYRGNVHDIFRPNDQGLFYALDASDVGSESFVPEMITDRVVIFGFMGDYLGDSGWPDRFYTPLNIKLAGITSPDMFGVVIHANILAMILSEDYIDELSSFNEFVVAFIACLIHILLLLIIAEKLPRWFDLLSIGLIIIQLLLYSYFRLFALQLFSYKINLAITLGSLAIASVTISLLNGLFNTYIYLPFLAWRNKNQQYNSPSLNAPHHEDPESHF